MKQKTKQAARKRFSFSSTGKVKRRHIGQAHFNSRNNGKEGRHKHGPRGVHSTDGGRIVQLLPNG